MTSSKKYRVYRDSSPSSYEISLTKALSYEPACKLAGRFTRKSTKHTFTLK